MAFQPRTLDSGAVFRKRPDWLEERTAHLLAIYGDQARFRIDQLEEEIFRASGHECLLVAFRHWVSFVIRLGEFEELLSGLVVDPRNDGPSLVVELRAAPTALKQVGIGDLLLIPRWALLNVTE